MRRLPAVAAVLLGAAALVAGDTWPQYRGPNGDGVSDATDIPTTWSETENVRWKAAVHDKGWSSPVVWRDKVWVTTAKEDGTDYYAVGLDRATGKVVHDVHLFHDPRPPDIRQFNSYASPTPCAEEGRLYAHFGSHGTACLDTATGTVLWERRDLPCNHWRGPASSPVVHNGWLYLTFDGFDRQYVACLDKHTGRTVWQKDRDLPYRVTGRPETDGDFKKAFATPQVIEAGGKPQLVSPAAMGTVAYDPATGAELWKVVHGGMNEAARPVAAHGLVYLTTGHTGSLLAVRPGTTGDLSTAGGVWRLDKVAPTKPSVLAAGGLLFLVNDTGIAFCLDAKTGKKHWQERLDGKFSASPVLAAGHVFFAGENGKTFVVAADKEFRQAAVNKLAGGCKASPAVAGDALFLRTETHLYCLANTN